MGFFIDEDGDTSDGDDFNSATYGSDDEGLGFGSMLSNPAELSHLSTLGKSILNSSGSLTAPLRSPKPKASLRDVDGDSNQGSVTMRSNGSNGSNTSRRNGTPSVKTGAGGAGAGTPGLRGGDSFTTTSSGSFSARPPVDRSSESLRFRRPKRTQSFRVAGLPDDPRAMMAKLDDELGDLEALATSETSLGGAEVSDTEAAAISAATAKVEDARSAFKKLRSAFKLSPDSSNAESVYSFLSKVRAAKSQLRRGRDIITNVEDERQRKQTAELLTTLSEAQGELVVLRYKVKDIEDRRGRRQVLGLHAAAAKVEAASSLEKHVQPSDPELVRRFADAVAAASDAVSGVNNALHALEEEEAAKAALQADATLEQTQSFREQRRKEAAAAEQLATAIATTRVAHSRLDRVRSNPLASSDKELIDLIDAAHMAVVAAEAMSDIVTKNDFESIQHLEARAGTASAAVDKAVDFLDQLEVEGAADSLSADSSGAGARDSPRSARSGNEPTPAQRLGHSDSLTDDERVLACGQSMSVVESRLKRLLTLADSGGDSGSSPVSSHDTSVQAARAVLDAAKALQLHCALSPRHTITLAFQSVVAESMELVERLGDQGKDEEDEGPPPPAGFTEPVVAGRVAKAWGSLATAQSKLSSLLGMLETRGLPTLPLGSVTDAVASAEQAGSLDLAVRATSAQANAFMDATVAACKAVQTAWMDFATRYDLSAAEKAAIGTHEALAIAKGVVATASAQVHRLREQAMAVAPPGSRSPLAVFPRYRLIQPALAVVAAAKDVGCVTSTSNDAEEVSRYHALATAAQQVATVARSRLHGGNAQRLTTSWNSDNDHLDFVFKASMNDGKAGDSESDEEVDLEPTASGPDSAELSLRKRAEDGLVHLREIEKVLARHEDFITNQAARHWKDMLSTVLRTSTQRIKVAVAFRGTLGVRSGEVTLPAVRVDGGLAGAYLWRAAVSEVCLLVRMCCAAVCGGASRGR